MKFVLTLEKLALCDGSMRQWCNAERNSNLCYKCISFPNPICIDVHQRISLHLDFTSSLHFPALNGYLKV